MKNFKFSFFRSFSDLKFRSLIFGIYSSILVFGQIHHTPWRDEVIPWSLTGSDTSFIEVLKYSNFEMHSPIFFIFLKVLHFISDNFSIFRIATIAINLIAVFMLLQIRKIPRVVLIVMSFNYYSLFEFAVIQRTYNYSFCLIVIICWALSRNLSNERPRFGKLFWISAILLALLSPWTPIFLLVTLCVLYKRKVIRIRSRESLILGLLTVFNFFFINLNLGRDWNISKGSISNNLNVMGLIEVFSAPMRALFILPKVNIHFWNTSIIESIPFFIVIISAFFYLLFIYYFLKVGNELKFFLIIAAGSTVLVSSVVGFGKQRHLGQIFLLFELFVLLYYSLDFSQVSSFPKLPSYMHRMSFVFFPLLNIYPLVVTFFFTSLFSFSHSWDLGSTIRDKDALIVYDAGASTFLPILIRANQVAYSPLGARVSISTPLDSKHWIYSYSPPPKYFCGSGADRLLLITNTAVLNRHSKLNNLPDVSTVSNKSIEGAEALVRIKILARTQNDVIRFCGEPTWSTFIKNLRIENTGYGV